MKLRTIQSKVLILFLLLTVVLLVVMSVMVRYGFKQQIDAYKQNQVTQLNQQVVQTLATYYQQNGNWNALDGNERLWVSLLLEGVVDSGVFQSARDKQRQLNPERADGRRANVHRAGARRLLSQFSLLDTQKKPVVGRINRPAKQYHISELMFNDQIVGYLLAQKPKPASIRGDDKLNQGIKVFLWTLGLVMLAITLLATWPIARYLTRPIKVINAATKQAAAGDFSVRTQLEREDELGQLSQNFNVMVSTLQSNAEVQKKMMADISHELRTPVAVLQAQIEAIQDGIHQADEKNLALLHQQIKALGYLINDIHQLSLADLGNMQYQMSATAIKPIIKSVVSSIRLAADEKNLTIKTDFKQLKADAQVMGDANRLEQLFNNILVNAVTYTNAGGQIKMKAYGDLQNNNYVIEVHDSEPGLSPAEMAQMFDRMYRKDPSRNKLTGGSGLGLAIVKKIVEAHNGSIKASGSELSGVCMTVRLPKHV